MKLCVCVVWFGLLVLLGGLFGGCVLFVCMPVGSCLLVVGLVGVWFWFCFLFCVGWWVVLFVGLFVLRAGSLCCRCGWCVVLVGWLGCSFCFRFVFVPFVVLCC